MRFGSRRARQRAVWLSLTSVAWWIGGPASVAGQTDYYNTDAGRPIRVEDAYPVDRYGFELQLAPVRLERSRDGVYTWGVEPELAYGILTRTHVQLGFPFAITDAGSSSKRSGLAGIDISVLHNLNAETTTIPALGLVGEVVLPAGGLAPERAYPSVKAIATRTFSGARLHVNAQYTFGSAPSRDEALGNESTEIGPGVVEVSRWFGGLAVDRTFPLHSLLVTGELFAEQPIRSAEDVAWNAAAGVRYQLDPRFSFDAGFGKRLTGENQTWFLTFGLARAFATPWLMPRR